MALCHRILFRYYNKTFLLSSPALKFPRFFAVFVGNFTGKDRLLCFSGSCATLYGRGTDAAVKKEYAARLREIMLETDEIANDIGTILFGEEAVRCGLIDGVGGLSDALEILRNMKKG